MLALKIEPDENVYIALHGERIGIVKWRWIPGHRNQVRLYFQLPQEYVITRECHHKGETTRPDQATFFSPEES